METKYEKLYKKKNELSKKYDEKNKELFMQNNVLRETESEIFELQSNLSNLNVKRGFAKNCDEILKKEKKKVIIRELISFSIIGVFATLTSLIPSFMGINGATIPMLISFLGLDALGCTIIGLTDYKEFKQIVKKYNLNKIEKEIKEVEKELEEKQIKIDSIKIVVDLLKQDISLLKKEQNSLDIKLNAMNNLILESVDKTIEENTNTTEKILTKVK